MHEPVECMRKVFKRTDFFGSSDMCHKSCRKTVKKKSPSGPFANLLSLCMRTWPTPFFFLKVHEWHLPPHPAQHAAAALPRMSSGIAAANDLQLCITDRTNLHPKKNVLSNNSIFVPDHGVERRG